MFTTRHITLSLVAALAVVVTFLIGFGSWDDPADRTVPADRAGATRTPRASEPTTPRTSPTATGTTSPDVPAGSNSPSARSGPTRPTASTTRAPGGGSPSATTPQSARPTATTRGAPPPSAGQRPTAAATTGSVVDGFPEMLEPPRGVAVRTSTISTDDQAIQATLVIVGDPEATVAHYRAVLGAEGFDELPAADGDGGRTSTFVAGRDTVVLTTADATTSLVADLHRESPPEEPQQRAPDGSSTQSDAPSAEAQEGISGGMPTITTNGPAEGP
jgi:hypothetical protein